MDPNVALEFILDSVEEFREALDNDEDISPDDISDLIDHIEGLHNWLARGGFKPDAWR